MDIDSMFLCGERLEEFDAIRSAGLEPKIDSDDITMDSTMPMKHGVIAAWNATVFGVDSGCFKADIASKRVPILSLNFTRSHLPRSRWTAVKDSFDAVRDGDGWCKYIKEGDQEVLRGEVRLAHSNLMLRCDTSGMMVSFFIKGGFLGIE
ncbi:MAG: hypothetical protein JSS75_11580 [Bacteroidetes bacterium]|nr:hypothetical protein [Bacteroidota bacterium]